MFAWSPVSTVVVGVDDLLVDAVQHSVERPLHAFVCHLEDLLGYVVAVVVLDEDHEVGPGQPRLQTRVLVAGLLELFE